MRVTRLTISVAEAAADDALATLSDEGLPFEQHDQTTIDRAPAGKVTLALYAEPGHAAELADRLSRRLLADGVSAGFATEECDGDAWRDAWKAYFRPRAVGPFVIAPSWEPYRARAGETVIELDPGRAFGTGGHASTRLCLRALGALGDLASDGASGAAGGGRRFLDVGCGSGVLAIACALRFPASSGVAIDVDPEAIEVTTENAAINRVAARVAASTTPLADVAGAFDVVLANISAETIVALAPSLVARVAPSGRLIASGILAAQADVALAALEAAGLRLARDDAAPATLDEDEWRALVCERAPAAAAVPRA